MRTDSISWEGRLAKQMQNAQKKRKNDLPKNLTLTVLIMCRQEAKQQPKNEMKEAEEMSVVKIVGFAVLVAAAVAGVVEVVAIVAEVVVAFGNVVAFAKVGFVEFVELEGLGKKCSKAKKS